MEKFVQENKPEKDLNFHQIAEDRKALRQERMNAGGVKKRIIESEIETLDEKASQFSIEDFGGLSLAKERILADRERSEKEVIPVINQEAIEKELGQSYKETLDLVEAKAELSEYEMSLLLQSKREPRLQERNLRMLQTAKNEKASVEAALNSKKENEPVVVRAAELVEYKKGISQEGHIAATPSVQKYLGAIGSRMIDGKPMFLHGPTGTGKTSLASRASEHFTGKEADRVNCNPQTRESNITVKTGIRPTEGGGLKTIDVAGPLFRAMKKGNAVVFDEFTALPKEQMVFLKVYFNNKVGDKIHIDTGNGPSDSFVIAPGFQMIFTANLKSEKNPERQELPPEIAREFEQNNLEVGYTPKEEAYDILLARLMNSDGSVDLSYHDLNVTLPKFCEAMSEVQEAYTGVLDKDVAQLTQTLGAGNKPPSLKKLVFTQGTVENILDAWKTEKSLKQNGRTFAEFLDERLQTTLTFKEYPETDRVLTAKILASKGFLRTLSEEELSLPPNTLGFDAARKLRGDEAKKELVANSGNVQHLSIKEVAELDPFGTRAKNIKAEAEGLLPQESKTKNKNAKSKSGMPEDVEGLKQSNAAFLEETFSKKWNWSADALEKAKNSAASLKSPLSLDWNALKNDTDPSKVGEYTLNPDTQDIDFANYPPGKIKVLELADMRGKSLAEVVEHLANTYGNTHYLPGIEYWKFIIENPDKAPNSLKDGKYHYFFPGSVFRYSSGRVIVPSADWDSSEFDRGGDWLGSEWGSGRRVVLLEK